MKIRRWILFALWLLSLAAISFYGGTVSYGFFFGITLLPVISLIYLACVYSRFRIFQKIENRNMVCGQPMPYFFVLQNDSHFAFTSVSVRLFSSFSYVEELPDNKEYELLPGDKFTYETQLICRYRGEYEVGVKKIIITDFLRLFRISYSIPSTIKAVVLPKIVHVDKLHSIADISAFLQRESANARTEPDILVRDYNEGDALKQLHWKATAREQKLKVRNQIGEEKQGISILCDTRRYSREEKMFLPLENKILETLLALGVFFAEKNMPFCAYCGQNGMTSWPVNGLQDFSSFYQKTAALSFGEEENIQTIALQVLSKGLLLQSRAVFFVVHELEDALLEITEQLTAGGIPVVVYLITEQNPEFFIKKGNPRRRIVVISPEAELEECL